MMTAQDKLIRFIFEDAPVRGEIVHLDESYREILKRHAYTLEVQQYLGEVFWLRQTAGMKFADWQIGQEKFLQNSQKLSAKVIWL